MLVSYSRLKKIAFICLALPSVIFALGFLRWYIGLAVAALVALACVFALRRTTKERSEEKEFFVSKLWLFFIGAAVLLWCYLAGLGNLYYQSGDWWARNAIFRDLISHPWPVTYEIKDAALVYYIGFWLPPALVGKVVLGICGDMEIAFFVGNIFLWLWSALCIFITVLVTSCFTRARRGRTVALLLAVFIFFSGLDIVGTVLGDLDSEIVIGDHIEWWTPYYQISSVTTCLFWVFNQAIFSWLTTACFLNEKSVKNYVFLLLACTPCSPFSCVGLGLYMLGEGAVRLVLSLKSKKAIGFLREVFSPQNILSLAVLPVYFLYYASNLGVGATKDNIVTLDEPVSLGALLFFGSMICFFSVSAFLMHKRGRAWGGLVALAIISAIFVLVAILNRSVRKEYVFTVILECGVYLLLLWKDNKRRPVFYLTLVLVLICPLIRIGTAADFCMRASMPAVFVLMALSVRLLTERGASLWERGERSAEQRKHGVICTLLIVVLLLGAVTPYKEIERGIVAVAEEGRVVLVNDYVYTLDRVFSGEQKDLDRNFIAADYRDKLFFRYLAKRN